MRNLLRKIFRPESSAARLPMSGVSFSSVWLGGFKGIQRLEGHQSSNLDVDRLRHVEAALAELKGGAPKSTPIEGIQYSRGIPRCFESQLDSFPEDAIRKSSRFFSCYWEYGTKPFLMSTLLIGDDTSLPVEAPPADFREFNDAYFLSEIFGLAGTHIPSEARSRAKAFATVLRHRPCVAFFQASEGTGEMLDVFSLPIEKILRMGFEAAVAMTAVQLLPPENR